MEVPWKRIRTFPEVSLTNHKLGAGSTNIELNGNVGLGLGNTIFFNEFNFGPFADGVVQTSKATASFIVLL